MIGEIKKYKERGLNKSQIARALNLSRNTVKKYLRQLKEEATKIQRKKNNNLRGQMHWAETYH